MRKFIILCLLAAIGAVAFIDRASAQQFGECRTAQGFPCAPHVWHGPGPGDNPGNPPQDPDWRKRHWHHRNDGPNFGIYLNLNPDYPPPPPPRYGNYYPANACREIAFDLRDQGFSRVRPLSCSGPRLIYSAWRDGRKLTLYVSRDGRIRRIIPAY